MTCIHCHSESAGRARGLCWRCYQTKGIREQYPTQIVRTFDHEPSMAELNALIAEQMRPENLPPWWNVEHEKMRAIDGVPIA